MNVPQPAVQSMFLPVVQSWLDKRTEEIIDPALPIIDPHHHLWERPGWRYLFEDLHADATSGHNVLATVYVQARSMYRQDGPEELRSLGETEYINGAAAMSASGAFGKPQLCAGIVGFVDLTLGDRVPEIAHRHTAAAGERFKGVRHTTAYDDSPDVRGSTTVSPKGLMASKEFRRGFAHLAKLGLSYDSWLYHPQIKELTDLARAFPETTIIMDHCGGPLGIGPYAGRRDEIFKTWEADVREIAKCPNVNVKLGGLGMKVNGWGFEKEDLPPTSEKVAATFKPYVETCIKHFGPERAMFESNFPVDKGSYSYAVNWNAFKRLAAGASADEKAKLFKDTAARVYRLKV
jgi:L-fuconolactonase